MGAVPRTPSTGGRPYPPPRPARRPPAGGAGEAVAAGYMPVLVPPGDPVPGWAAGFLGDVVEHRTADGTVVARYATGRPRTSLVARLRDDPVVVEFLQQEATAVLARAEQAVTRLPGNGLSSTRRARAAEWTYSPADATWGDIALEVVPAAWSRYWDANRRLFAWLVRNEPARWLGASVALAGMGLTYIASGQWWGWVGAVVVFWAGSAAALRVGNTAARRDDRAMVADLVAGVADRHPDGFTFRDTEVVAFTPVCVCPSCDVLALHWLAAAEVVPEHTATDLPGPVVWRECAGIGCGFVWAQNA